MVGGQVRGGITGELRAAAEVNDGGGSITVRSVRSFSDINGRASSGVGERASRLIPHARAAVLANSQSLRAPTDGATGIAQESVGGHLPSDSAEVKVEAGVGEVTAVEINGTAVAREVACLKCAAVDDRQAAAADAEGPAANGGIGEGIGT